MDPTSLTIDLVRIAYVLVGLAVLAQYVADRSPARADVLFMMLTLVIPCLTDWGQRLGLPETPLQHLSALALMLHPWSTLRLVWRVRPRIRWLDWLAGGASVGSLPIIVALGPPPLPDEMGALLLLLWVLIEVVAVGLLVGYARLSTGSHRFRVLLAASGPAALGLTFGIILGAMACDMADAVAPVITPIIVLSAFGFALGFMPPGRLIRAVQLEELYRFLSSEKPRYPRSGPSGQRMLGGCAYRMADEHDPLMHHPAVKGSLRGRALNPAIVGLPGCATIAAPIGRGAIFVSLPVEPLFGTSDAAMLGLIADAAAEELYSASQIDQAERLAAKMTAANEELERFAYLTSHDLQEPLRMVASFLDLLREDYGAELNEEAQSYIDTAVGGAQRMGTMIRGLLDFSCASREDHTLAEVPLSVVTGDALANLACMDGMAEADIAVGTLPTVVGDRVALTQVFQNLVSNAVKYSPSPARVEVAAQRRDGGWEITVRDHGLGIAEEHHQRVFELFARLHRSEYEGTGLGLAMVKRIVERHGGRIAIRPVEGAGTCVGMWLPVAA